jgi:F-type H+-transporting ATPase subunit b
MEALGIDGKLLLGQIVNFLILLVLLRVFLYGPLVKMLEERREKAKKSLFDAQEIEKKLAETDKKSKEIMQNTSNEASRIIEETQKIAAKEKKDIIENAKTQAEKILKDAHTEAKKSKDGIIAEAKREIAGVITLALDKIVGKGLDENEKGKLIKKSIEDINEN